MPIKLTKEAMRAIFPRAPQAVLDAFVAKQDVLTKAGINATRNRLAFFFANIEHECGGFTIPNLTENINYTAARMAQVWPNRFKNASAVVAKYGQAAGWQKRAFDDIYGARMGNRPGTSDGSTFIGRGGPQWTGRGGYEALQKLTGLPVVDKPSMASQLDLQPEICAAFWTWKGLNRYADANDFLGCVKAWNGGTNGLADRKAMMAGNDPILKRLESVSSVAAAVPDAKQPVATKEQAGSVVAAAAVSAAATAGAHAGWPWWAYALLAVGVVAVVAALYFGLRCWERRNAAQTGQHDEAVAATAPSADRLPAPATLWVASDAQVKKPIARKARAPAKKPAAKKAAKKSTKKRKAA